MKRAVTIFIFSALLLAGFIAVLPGGTHAESLGANMNDFKYMEKIELNNSASVINLTVTKGGSEIIGTTNYWVQVSNPESSTHEFQVVRDEGAHAHVFNLNIDGQTWKYIAYDSDQNGNGIRMYMSNDMKTWTPYSGNPILSGTDLFRWPSTIYYDGTFYMFVNERENSDVVLYTSTDAIHYTKQNVVLTGDTTTNNPYIYLNPNDHKFYLYNHQANGTIAVKVADSISGLASATNTIIFTGSAAPAVVYYGGYYYMFVEQGSYANNWYVELYRSTNPTTGFSDYKQIVIQANNEACPTVAYDDSGHYYLFTNHYYGDGSTMTTWSPRERSLIFTLSYNGTRSDYSDIAFFNSMGAILPYEITSYNSNEAHFLVNINGTHGKIIYAYGSDSYNPSYTTFPKETQSKTLFSDNFESGSLSTDWDYVGSDWSIQSTSTGNHYARGIADSNDNWDNTRLKKTINAGGDIIINADVYVTSGNPEKKVSIKATVNGGSDTLYLVEFFGDKTVRHYDGNHVNWTGEHTYQLNTWMHVELQINTDNSTASLWINDTAFGTIPLKDGAGNTVSGPIYDIWFESSTTAGSTISIDNVTIVQKGGSAITYPEAQITGIINFNPSSSGSDNGSGSNGSGESNPTNNSTSGNSTGGSGFGIQTKDHNMWILFLGIVIVIAVAAIVWKR